MKLYLRIFIVYFLLLGLAGYYLYTLSINEIKPAMRQSSEEVLVDVANLLAEIIEPEFSRIDFDQSDFRREVDDFLSRSMTATIFSVDKSRSNLRIYITDAKGIVRYHSGENARTIIGQDYSRWNDVYLTLKGRYGARSTEDISGNPLSTVMYVAAPILREGEIIGVLTVGKPGIDVQPFIDRSIANLKKHGIFILIISLMLGIALSYWLTQSIRRLTNYAKAVSKGESATLPTTYDNELKLLGNSMEEMRQELEGKNYVEQYVHSLTHELKSPISAINGASELISQQMDEQDFNTLKNNILGESARLNDFVNRLLDLVRVEKLSVLDSVEPVQIGDVVQDVIETKRSQFDAKHVDLSFESKSKSEPCLVMADRFLLKQCLDNLLQNALDFSPEESSVDIDCYQKESVVEVNIMDSGDGIPEYALERIFERFYSLNRPNGAPKSSGIGLSFVKQIIQLHNGDIWVKNRSSGGVIATICLPVK